MEEAITLEVILEITIAVALGIIVLYIGYRLCKFNSAIRVHTRICESLKPGDQVAISVDGEDFVAVVFKNHPESRRISAKILRDDTLYTIDYSEIIGPFNAEK